MEIESLILERAKDWLSGSFDEETKASVKILMETNRQNSPIRLPRSWICTGGLRESWELNKPHE